MREAYKGTSSIENGGRKSPIKIEIRKDFYLITVSFTIFICSQDSFYYFSDFFGLAKCENKKQANLTIKKEQRIFTLSVPFS